MKTKQKIIEEENKRITKEYPIFKEEKNLNED